MKKRFSLLLLLLPVLIVCCESRKEKDAVSKEEILYKEDFLAVDTGVKIFYQQVGNGKDITIIPAGWWLYDDFKHLRKDNQTFVFFDMRNRGRSDLVEDTSLITIQEEVEDIEKLRKHVNADKINLIGFSYLGLLVMLYADKYPEHVGKIVQIGPVPVKWDTAFPDSLKNAAKEPSIEKAQIYIDSLIAQKYNEKEPEKFTRIQWDTLIRQSLVGDPSNSDKLGKQWGDHVKYRTEWDINFMRHLKYHFGSILTSTFTTQQFADIKSPVLVIHGTKDRNGHLAGVKNGLLYYPMQN